MHSATPPPPAKGHGGGARRHSIPSLIVVALLGLGLCLGFAALGTWQVYRRAWKLDLIARVQSRVHAAPQAAPGPGAWPQVTAAADAYRHVSARGVFLNDRETRVQALTELGGGFWVLTPLRTQAGFVVLVNRGFTPYDHASPGARLAGRIAGPATVTGLLRITEPRGSFIQRNDPAHGRWYSRDVEAIAATQRLGDVAPYFIDADATPNPGGWPVGGLTVISFPNSHLVYAVTWYALALLVLGAGGLVGRQEWRARTRRAATPSAAVEGVAAPGVEGGGATPSRRRGRAAEQDLPVVADRGSGGRAPTSSRRADHRDSKRPLHERKHAKARHYAPGLFRNRLMVRPEKLHDQRSIVYAGIGLERGELAVRRAHVVRPFVVIQLQRHGQGRERGNLWSGGCSRRGGGGGDGCSRHGQGNHGR